VTAAAVATVAVVAAARAMVVGGAAAAEAMAMAAATAEAVKVETAEMAAESRGYSAHRRLQNGRSCGRTAHGASSRRARPHPDIPRT
jgi:hypothetical protein